MFYLARNEAAIPLFLVTREQWKKGLESLDNKERNYFLARQFKGQYGDLCVIHDENGKVSKAFIGVTEGEEALALANAAISLPPGCYVPQQALSQAAKVSWSLAQYRFNSYKKQEWLPRTLVVGEEALSAVVAESNAIFLVRDLINTPTNDMGPEELGRAMETVGKSHHALYKQWVGGELEAAHLHAIHVVGRASAKAPRLLTLEWGSTNNPKVVLVGKGVCFDSGGLDLKPSQAMRLMKKDMAGAAHAIGLAQWIMIQKLPVHLRVLIPAVENAVGPEAFRPGDIIRMYNGLTVEIDNTDAEGRLILADAMAKACEEKTDLLIDFATLTGAARAAVGTDIAAMFTNNDQLAQDLMESSLAVNDPLWRLPLFAGYESMLESKIADLLNSSPIPYAGAISAALFLQHFIPKKVPWVHFDIMAWNIASKPGKPEGGEAMGLRALMHYLIKTYGCGK